ncbi:TfoX/Sxy family protein [Aminobacter sp. MET-1]|uniref:TfoX/Sxy family protein n=1 Tax=Aminobacter sp. MET-1 TaxID=2951085 RepID=UPI00226AD682|nr:TfoX/Sxy family protein [Aminobacter sp. MET-1]MCX8568003.1 TfoX/Sxy family protein [Aminobacter sp. MET-1]
MADDLAERIRHAIGEDPNVGEIRMFGGTCFTLNGNMLVGTLKDGALLARVGDEQEPAALAMPGAKRMDFTGREMKGFIMVDAVELDDTALGQWIAMASRFVGPMPPKKKR